VAGSGLAVAACATAAPAALREQAALHFFCPEDDLTIVSTLGDAYRVDGCNKSATYRCRDGRWGGLECAPEDAVVVHGPGPSGVATMYWVASGIRVGQFW